MIRVSCFITLLSAVACQPVPTTTDHIRPSAPKPQLQDPALQELEPSTLNLKATDRPMAGHVQPVGLAVHPVALNPLEPIDLYPEEDTAEEIDVQAPHRARQRMNIDQLDRAIQQVTGGLEWTDDGNNPKNLFEELSLTLGRPDYIQVVIEDLTPSGLFLKFVDDAARSVCKKLVEVEVSERTAETRVLMGIVSPDANYVDDAAGIDAQLARLSLLYHGIALQEDSGALENLRWLFQMAQMRMGQPEAGWEAVCVSLMTDPAFYSF
ncbi:MAG: hypothetical protein CMH56_11455 [Myxococcales bacterium]|nr:hypothetical protein [Myxococcales bacterium]|tara:strand:- start:1048 stop:1845 length:798 start_codon:yes stop_codon:yes gene_type:complete